MPFFDSELEKRIKAVDAVVCVIGLGYVGLPIAVRMARAGYEVIGIDLSEAHIAALKAGDSIIDDVSQGDLKQVDSNISFLPVKEDFAETALGIRTEIASADVFVVCVPTPLRYGREVSPKEDYLENAAEIINHVNNIEEKNHRLVVVESTTYPGCTERVFDFPYRLFSRVHIAYSPERINPGGKLAFEEINKVVGASTNTARELAKKLYTPLFENGQKRKTAHIIDVGSTDAAEAVKCAENGFRLVSISFANELARLAPRWGVDIWSVIRAVKASGPRVNLPDMLDGHPVSEYVFDPKAVDNMAKDLKESMALPRDRTISSLANLCFQDVASRARSITDSQSLVESVIRYYDILSRVFMYELSYFCRGSKGRVAFKDVYNGILSKPFGLDFCEPGPGAGGHCIPVDPVYLAHQAKKNGTQLGLIEEAYSINERMPLYITRMISYAIARYTKVLKVARILILGVTYKPNVADLRESKALDIMNLLIASGAEVSYCDPVYSRRQRELYRRADDFGRRLVSLKKRTRSDPRQKEVTEQYVVDEVRFGKLADRETVEAMGFDCAVLVTDHLEFKEKAFQETLLKVRNLAIVDTHNVFDPDNKSIGFPKLRVWGR